jgi:serine/threonine protein kinase
MITSKEIEPEERIKCLDDFIFEEGGSLGSGSFASVRLGISKKTGRKYAIKMVKLKR